MKLLPLLSQYKADLEYTMKVRILERHVERSMGPAGIEEAKRLSRTTVMSYDKALEYVSVNHARRI